ncbi:ExeM/NucH family extracellular endonuclease [Corynebacterium otitidis]
MTRPPRPYRSLLALGLAGLLAAAPATATLAAAEPAAPAGPASAAEQAQGPLINEVYGGGGNKNAAFTHDFVELYNPTPEPISLDGWVIEQRSEKGNVGTTVELSGTIEPGGYFLVRGYSNGDNGRPLDEFDQDSAVNFAASGAIAVLLTPAGEVADLVGWGSPATSTGQPAEKTSNTTSIQRREDGAHTGNNAADFHAAEPTPKAGGAAPGPGTPPGPGEEPERNEVPISEIQSEGPESPLAGEAVATEGVVTAAYPEGGLRGFFMQEPGSGGEAPKPGEASRGIFVAAGPEGLPEPGDAVLVTGTAREVEGLTQIDADEVSPAFGAVDPVAPVELDEVPAGDEARESLEGMLVAPTGAYTVTDTYELATYGSVGLAPGERPFRQPTSVHEPSTDPDSPVQVLAREQDELEILLDDGRSGNYQRGDSEVPPAYLSADGGETITPLRVGDRVDFSDPVVLDHRFGDWRLQPTGPLDGRAPAGAAPIDWRDSRPGDAPKVPGDVRVATFNVLNYFPSLGKDEPGCRAYRDREGNPQTARGCRVRGAFDEAAFAAQQEKIVAALNKLDAEVVALEEVENTASLTGDAARRDEALAHLVDALNEAGGEWDYVPSPKDLPADEDTIRLGFIYRPDAVAPSGESRILDHPAFRGVARQPLAQEFELPSGNRFVAVANHFKSKGSVVFGDEDRGDGQANNPAVRTAQAEGLADELEAIDEWGELPVVLLGDFNSYAKEDPLRALEGRGFELLDEGEQFSYVFEGRVGSLDHALVNEHAAPLVAGLEVWPINSPESLAFEYSRRNNNVVDFHAANEFRSSDHDPLVVGLSLKQPEEPPAAPPTSPVPGEPTERPEEPSGPSAPETTPAEPAPSEPSPERPEPEPSSPTTPPTETTDPDAKQPETPPAGSGEAAPEPSTPHGEPEAPVEPGDAPEAPAAPGATERPEEGAPATPSGEENADKEPGESAPAPGAPSQTGGAPSTTSQAPVEPGAPSPAPGTTSPGSGLAATGAAVIGAAALGAVALAVGLVVLALRRRDS